MSPVWNFHSTPLACVGPPLGYTPVRSAFALKVAAPASGGPLVPVGWVVTVVDCVVDGDVDVVVLVWKREQPVRSIVSESRAMIDRTSNVALVDFTANQYLLVRVRRLGYNTWRALEQGGGRPRPATAARSGGGCPFFSCRLGRLVWRLRGDRQGVVADRLGLGGPQRDGHDGTGRFRARGAANAGRRSDGRAGAVSPRLRGRGRDRRLRDRCRRDGRGVSAASSTTGAAAVSAAAAPSGATSAACSGSTSRRAAHRRHRS